MSWFESSPCSRLRGEFLPTIRLPQRHGNTENRKLFKLDHFRKASQLGKISQFEQNKILQF